MGDVAFRGATRQYPGSDFRAVDELDLDIEDGEFLVLVGPSGCGKSTSLRMLAGLEPVNSGTVSIGGRDVTDFAPRDRDIAMVFQNYALYPHMSVADNMAFALKIGKVPKDERTERVGRAAKLLDLVDYVGRTPKALSGGQRQRVAMGRALVRKPEVFLMDEPLSNLDAKLRVQTRTEISALQRRLETTTVYVTHDQVEAMTMGDRVAVLDRGTLQQVGSPQELYKTPDNVFVAGFIGSPGMNLIHDAPVSGTTANCAGFEIALERDILGRIASENSETVTIGLRPEHLTLGSEGVGIPLIVVGIEELGADAYIYGELMERGERSSSLFAIRVQGEARRRVGSTVWASPIPGETHVFSTKTGRRLNDSPRR